MDKSANRNGDIIIDLPASREEPRFPQERWKTLLGNPQMLFWPFPVFEQRTGYCN